MNISSYFLSDLSEVPISKDHMRDFIGWQRPSELLSHKFSDEFDSHHHLCTPSMAAFAPVDLVQDVTADCSVVASLCAALARPGTCSGEVSEQDSRWALLTGLSY